MYYIIDNPQSQNCFRNFILSVSSTGNPHINDNFKAEVKKTVLLTP